jgi:hypothetical protein
MTTLAELAAAYDGDGTDYMPHEIGYGQDDDLSGIRIQPGDTPETVTIVLDYQISLDWHLIYETTPVEDGNYNSPLSEDGHELKDGWEDLYWENEDAWREWMRVAGNVISERYQGECLDMVGNVLSFAEVRTAPSTLTIEELPEWLWENTSVVRIINETDPGTYNSGYLFSIIRNALENNAPYDVESV